MSPGRWLLAAILLGGAVGAVAASWREEPPDRLVGWPSEAATVPMPSAAPAAVAPAAAAPAAAAPAAAAPASAAPASAPVDPGACQRARASAKAVWAVMSGATERWAAEVAASPEAATPGDVAGASAVAAAVRRLADGRGDARALATALQGTSVPLDRYAEALAATARADAACRIGPPP